MNTSTIAKFSVGDIVMLTCGGPYMSVYSISENDIQDSVKCTWFDTTGIIHYEDIRPEVLVYWNDLTTKIEKS